MLDVLGLSTNAPSMIARLDKDRQEGKGQEEGQGEESHRYSFSDFMQLMEEQAIGGISVDELMVKAAQRQEQAERKQRRATGLAGEGEGR